MQQAEGSVSGKPGVETALTAADGRTPASAHRDERKIVGLFCLVAAIHVFVFSAAFPFFGSVDEPSHFDLVVKYSHGHVPRNQEPFSPDSAVYLTLFSSCAYLGTPDKFPGNQMPSPLWTEPVEQMKREFAAECAGWQLNKNYEVSQCPLYYALAGAWWRAGELCGLNNGGLLYSLRFLNVIQIVVLVWLAWFAARLVFPGNIFVRMAVIAIVAFIPQSAFYSVDNDMLSTLCFGAAFICLLKWLFSEKPPGLCATAMGLAFAATYLTKATNIPLLAVVIAALGIKAFLDLRDGKLQRSLPGFASFIFCAALPILAWMAWCKINYGDLSGSKIKEDKFGWTVKAFGDWWHHPIFTPAGLWTYLAGEIGTFWQGELLWHNQSMALPFTNNIYCLLSLILAAAVLWVLLRRSAGAGSMQRVALWFGLACFAAGLAFFGLMSIVYDFHDCPNPSRDHPYFQAGRMIIGCLVPFLLVIAYGLDRVLCRFGNVAKFGTLAVVLLGMLAVEIATDWPAFSNPFNWYHLP